MTDPDVQQVALIGETFMMHFAVGEQVIIRYGKHQGLKANIIKNPQADVYKVKVEDGYILYFSGKGLERETEAVYKSVCWHR